MFPQPCKPIADAIAKLETDIVNLEQSIDLLEAMPHPGSKLAVLKAQLATAQAQLATKQADLAACKKKNRPFTIKGTIPVPGTVLTEFDQAMEDFCRANDARTCQLTLLKNGQLKFAHAYTLADPPYPATGVDHTFRIASISKAFTCAGIQMLLDAKKLKLDDPVFPLLGIKQKALAGQVPDPNVDKILVSQVVDHLGGWNDQAQVFLAATKKPVPMSGFDPVFRNRDIALKLSLAGPPSKMDIARYMYGEPLQFTPGASLIDLKGKPTGAYSNFGYLLLGLAIETAAGMPYIDYLRQAALEPISVNDVFLARMLAGPAPREVSYDDAGTGPNALEPHANVTVANPYGGGGFVTELMDSAGGLLATATSMAQFINKFPVWGLGHGRAVAARSGGMSGTSSWAASRTDGIDYAFVFNTSTFPSRPVSMDPDPNSSALITVLHHLMDTVKL